MKEDEEKNAIEAEKLRIKMNKEMLDQKRIQDEQQKKRDAEAYAASRTQEEKDRQEMLRILEEDQKRKFGDKYVDPKAVDKKKTPRDEVVETYDKMYKIYRMGQLSLLHTCVKTLESIAARILASPGDPAVRTINALNPNFCERVKDVVGGAQVLTLMGFQERDNQFVMDHPDLDRLREIQQVMLEKRDYLASQF